VGTHGFSGNDDIDNRRQGETYEEFQKRVIDTYERRHARPKMTLELAADDGSRFYKALVKNLYPDSEYDDNGNLTVIKKSGALRYEFIYLRIGDVECRFRFSGEGGLNWEDQVMTMQVEYVGFPEE
jgi:hypothetical protein